VGNLGGHFADARVDPVGGISTPYGRLRRGCDSVEFPAGLSLGPQGVALWAASRSALALRDGFLGCGLLARHRFTTFFSTFFALATTFLTGFPRGDLR